LGVSLIGKKSFKLGHIPSKKKKKNKNKSELLNITAKISISSNFDQHFD